MSYYFTKIMDLSFNQALEHVTEELKKEGFGVLTEIDVQSTLKEKLDVDFRKYKILGACNPPFAHGALQSEPLIGLMLPCNVVVHETENGKVEIAAIDPVASMQSVENEELKTIAIKVQKKLKRIIKNL